MAITIYRQANSKDFASIPIYPHANTGFNALTFGSDKFADYSDFQYYIEVNDYKVDKIYKNLLPPLNISGFSYFNIVQGIQSNVEYHYNPSATSIINAPEHMGKYQFTVYENYNGANHLSRSIQGIYANMSLSLWDNREVYQVNPLNYQFNSINSEFLTYSPTTSKVKLADEGTWKGYYGGTEVILANRSFLNEVKYEITKPDGTIVYYTLTNNIPWVNISNLSETDASNNTVQIPVMPHNLTNGSFLLTKVVLPNGYIFYPNMMTEINLDKGDKYCLYVYSTTAPYLNQRVSKKYCFDIECDDYSDLLVSWENELGGTDYYNFSMKEQVTVSNKTKTYTNNRNGWMPEPNLGGIEFYYGMKDKRRDTIYQDTYRENYKLTSRLLNEEEIEFVNHLFSSKNIEIRIKGEWYPALPNKKTIKLLNNKVHKLKYYQFELTVDKDKNLL